MAEEIKQPQNETTPTDSAAELTVLKAAHQEVLTKRQRDKAKIIELETASATLQAELTATRNQVHEITVSQPLKQLAESISTVPNVWLEVFGKHFDVANKDGILVISDKAGKAVTNQNGQRLKFNHTEIAKFLTESEPDSERTRLFRVITISSRASGAAGTPRNNTNSSSDTNKYVYGFG